MSLDFPTNDKMIHEAPAKKVFIFPGDGIWHPERIEAASVAEAEAIYHKIKQLINPPEPTALSTPHEEKGGEGVQ